MRPLTKAEREACRLYLDAEARARVKAVRRRARLERQRVQQPADPRPRPPTNVRFKLARVDVGPQVKAVEAALARADPADPLATEASGWLASFCTEPRSLQRRTPW